MNLSNFKLKQKLVKKRSVKVITGLSNFNINNIMKKTKAAELGGATYVDIAANPDIVLTIKSITHLPICVSSINPVSLYQCVLAGASIIEIGNFDIFYDKNIHFCEKQILALVAETKLLVHDVTICVTIPHTLFLQEQIQLAIKLQNMGVNILQTEGSYAKNRALEMSKSKIFKSTYRASSAISSSYAITNYVDIPVIASSGLDTLSAPIAISYGASCIGLGSVLNQFQDISLMANYINEIVSSLSNYYTHPIHKLDDEFNKYFKMYPIQNLSRKV